MRERERESRRRYRKRERGGVGKEGMREGGRERKRGSNVKEVRRVMTRDK